MPKSRTIVLVTALSTFVLLSGCVTKAPPSQADKLPVQAPNSYYNDHDRTPFWNDGWTQDIQDPQLPKIIAEALEHNYNLLLAEGRLEAAMATAVIQGSAKYPSLNMITTGSRAQRNPSGGNQINSPRSNTFALTGRTTWELDIWGIVRDQANAGYADYQASVEDFRAARFSIAAQTARAWYRAISSELQLDIAIESLETFESNLQIIEENFKRGIARALDLHLVRANVANAKSDYEGRLRTRDGDHRSLEILLGRYPSREIQVTKVFPAFKNSIPVGLPDELLNRRPDIRAAERRLASDSMNIKAAKKAMLPGINLNGNFGTSTREIDNVLEIEDLRYQVWNFGYNINLPVFQGGRLLAAKDRAYAVYTQSLANYAQTVLEAFEEVETSLADESSLLRDEAALRETVVEYEAAVELAWEQYGRGLVDIITVLDSQRRLYNANRSLIIVSNQRIQGRIGLYQALGGGFVADNDESQIIK
ncbi:MAG: TolC family protein [Verrucomicrobia bacterium]|nr:TolC family protein [Verrucomicrobiota bacterium]MDA1069038.1 TolC family protein [Verrucomicrobiota bacterium]